MKYIFILLIFAATSHVSAQNSCDNLQLDDVRYHAFSDTLINVYCSNWNQTEIFSYPGFLLRNANGDSVAAETVNYFGIGNAHVASMRIVDGATFENNLISGTLELWTGFYDALACTYAIDESLCPTDDCNSLSLSIVNMGGALTNGFFNYTISTVNGGTILEGQMMLDDDHQDSTITLCLPNGHYSLTIESVAGTMAGQPWATLTEVGPFNSPALQVPLPHEMTTVMDVPLYTACTTQIPNSVAQLHVANAVFTLLPDGIAVDATGSGQLSIVDMKGRLIATAAIVGHGNVMGLKSGLYIATYNDLKGSGKSIKMFIR